MGTALGVLVLANDGDRVGKAVGVLEVGSMDGYIDTIAGSYVGSNDGS